MTATVEAGPSHRERKKLATRQAIHDAAFELAEEHGLAHTTVEAISDRAGVSPRTFWGYFSSKEDAILNRDPGAGDQLHAALLARPAGEHPVTALRVVVGGYMAGRISDSRRSVRRQRLIRREPQLMAATAAVFDDFERALVAAVAQRLGIDARRSLLPGVLVSAACGACRVAQQHWADANGRRPLAELFDEAFVHLAPLTGEAAE